MDWPGWAEARRVSGPEEGAREVVGVSLSDEIWRLHKEGMTRKELVEAGFLESTIRYALGTRGRLLGGAGRFSSGLVKETVTDSEPVPEAFFRVDIQSGRVLLDRREDALKYRGGAY
jgi:hypothetical protein